MDYLTAKTLHMHCAMIAALAFLLIPVFQLSIKNSRVLSISVYSTYVCFLMFALSAANIAITFHINPLAQIWLTGKLASMAVIFSIGIVITLPTLKRKIPFLIRSSLYAFGIAVFLLANYLADTKLA
ncbi:SirB2 family protein [Teredinibacter purpureus]|uniref:SirB2 family protein n=1 Tax=Teredinibacter purpureus TaxID=2731756 RepID=UPI0005F81A65|nr:SirB2 family protein [Teredinibacter purpureus]